ncbi:MAG: tRNA adenosine(34) deaminase TadA [Cyanobacteriota bacterium]
MRVPKSSEISEVSGSIYDRHCRWMQRAIALATAAGNAGEVPVGAVVVAPDDTLIATGENRRERDHDPTAHAEILALRQAGQHLGSWRLEDCTLYVTLEPCPMCAGAIALSRLGTLVYGADDPKAGAIRTVLNLPDSAASNHSPRVLPGVLEAECRAQLQQWFARRRGNGESGRGIR